VGGGGETLGAVAAIMRARSDEAGPLIRELADDISVALDLLGDIGFRIATSKLQTEMMSVFVHELLEEVDDPAARGANLAALAECLETGFERVSTSLTSLDTRLRSIQDRARRLADGLETLRALEVNGRIEAARASDTGAVEALFRTIGEQIRTARAEVADFGAVGRVARDGRLHGAQRMQARVHELRERVAEAA
jgi:hypothetical protein